MQDIPRIYLEALNVLFYHLEFFFNVIFCLMMMMLFLRYLIVEFESYLN